MLALQEEKRCEEENKNGRSFKIVVDKITQFKQDIPISISISAPTSDATSSFTKLEVEKLSNLTFAGKNPMQAAKKAFTQICKTFGKRECKYIFTIQEILPVTSDKTGKNFIYSGIRQLKLCAKNECDMLTSTVHSHRLPKLIKPKLLTAKSTKLRTVKSAATKSTAAMEAAALLAGVISEPKPLFIAKKTVPPLVGE